MEINEKEQRVEFSGTYTKNPDDIEDNLTIFSWSTGESSVSITLDWSKTGKIVKLSIQLQVIDVFRR